MRRAAVALSISQPALTLRFEALVGSMRPSWHRSCASTSTRSSATATARPIARYVRGFATEGRTRRDAVSASPLPRASGEGRFEIDILGELGGGRVVAVEVKANAAPTGSDGPMATTLRRSGSGSSIGRLELRRRQIALDVAAGKIGEGGPHSHPPPHRSAEEARVGMAAQRGKVLMWPKRSTTSATSPRVGQGQAAGEGDDGPVAPGRDRHPGCGVWERAAITRRAWLPAWRVPSG